MSKIISCPGLTAGAQQIQDLSNDLPKSIAAFRYKQLMPCLWVILVGGTGTGKSTLFNILGGGALSATGIERPKTSGPIAYAHRDCRIEREFPFPGVEIERHSRQDFESNPATGRPKHLLVLEHDTTAFRHLVLVDAPDLDSIHEDNRRIAEDFYLLSDAVIFLTSQEKYADEVPTQFLRRVMGDAKILFFVLNKAQEQLASEECVAALNGQGLHLRKERIWIIPHVSAAPFREIPKQPGFRDLSHAFSNELSFESTERIRREQQSERARNLRLKIRRLLDLLEEENRAAQEWLSRLETLHDKICRDLVEKQKRRFTEENRESLRREIRRLLAHYDVLAKPRRLVKELLLTPLRRVGIYKKRAEATREQTVLEARRKMDLTSVYGAIERFHGLVVEQLSPPHGHAPLYTALRRPDLVLTDQEVKEHVWKEQDRLAMWLEERFQKLSEGLPRGRKWGIYSTSILWGMLIVSLETALGGGFTVLDAVLDSALAPFVTKGAVELFAYQEVQRTAKELAKRHEQGLLSVCRRQRDRYVRCLHSFLTSREGLESLEALYANIENANWDAIKPDWDSRWDQEGNA